MQEIGETVQEIAKADDKAVEAILNKRPNGHYWIVIAYKPTHLTAKGGQHVIRRVVKAYDTKPPALLGTIVKEVKDGEVIDEQINIHDIPIDWQAVAPYLGWQETPYVQKRPDIAHAYLYNR